MRLLIYKCMNCGTRFYYRNEEADAMKAYISGRIKIDVMNIHKPPLLCELLDKTVKCCGCPNLGIVIP